eukprot:jgi/Phyca11/96296/e_gw1.1.1626.1
MKLQSDDLNLLDARDFLDGLLEVKPSFHHYLAADVTEETAKVGFADMILKRRKVQEDKSAYSQLTAISPTSNTAERLFSMARMVLRYERNRLSPLMLEMLLFLKLNSKYWDVTTVDAVI